MSALRIAKKRRRSKIDHDVIVTEPDHKRARKYGDDDEDEEDEKPAAPIVRSPYSSRSQQMIRVSQRMERAKSDSSDTGSFPFLALPPEIRNMVYRYCLVSQAPNYSGIMRNNPLQYNVDLGKHSCKVYQRGGIEIAMMLVCKMVSNEAISVMYTDNRFGAVISDFGVSGGIDFRVDEKRSQIVSCKKLRSGRNIDMLNHSGIVYEHVVLQLRNVHIDLQLNSGRAMCFHQTLRSLALMEESIDKLSCIIDKFVAQGHYSPDDGNFSGLGDKTRWTLRVQSPGNMALWMLSEMFSPLLMSQASQMMQHQNFCILLEGLFPRRYKRYVFGDLSNYKKAFITEGVTRDRSPTCEVRSLWHPWMNITEPDIHSDTDDSEDEEEDDCLSKVGGENEEIVDTASAPDQVGATDTASANDSEVGQPASDHHP